MPQTVLRHIYAKHAFGPDHDLYMCWPDIDDKIVYIIVSSVHQRGCPKCPSRSALQNGAHSFVDVPSEPELNIT